MSGILAGGIAVIKYLARPVGAASATLARVAAVATLSTAQTLAHLMHIHIIPDIQVLKRQLLQKGQANADRATADAAIKIAEAAEASNKATLQKQMIRAAVELKDLEVEEKKVLIEEKRSQTAIQIMDAETRRFTAKSEADARVIEAISKLRQEGGGIYLNEVNLKRILNSPLPSDESNRK